MAIYRHSRYTDSYVFADPQNRDIIHLDPIQEPTFSPAQDDLLVEINDGDRLDLLAHRFLGDATLDWVILEANPELKSPFDIVSGGIVRIPMPEKVGSILA